MMLPSLVNVKASAAAESFQPHHLRSRRGGKNTRSRCRRRQSSACNVAAVVLLLLLVVVVALPQLSDALQHSGAECGCQFNNTCFPNTVTLRTAVHKYTAGIWATAPENVVYGLNISEWCVDLITNMDGMFYRRGSFNEDLSLWNTASVTSMTGMFGLASSFTGDGIGAWNVSSVGDMGSMFRRASSFTGEGIGSWNTASVTNMFWMFRGASSFTGDGIGAWNVSSVGDMGSMFRYASSFTGDGIGSWNVSSVTYMAGMFYVASSFTGDGIGSWNVSSVGDMGYMFYGASSFNESLCSWGDDFPYNNAEEIFMGSNCTDTTTPIQANGGPFCADDCGALSAPPSMDSSVSPSTMPSTTLVVERTGKTPKPRASKTPKATSLQAQEMKSSGSYSAYFAQPLLVVTFVSGMIMIFQI